MTTSTEREEQLKQFLKWRYVEVPCPKCRGAGRRMYGHGSTWRGGVGTCSFEPDICDECWGSGEAGNPGLNLRTYEAETREAVQVRALSLLAENAGAFGSPPFAATREIAAELRKLARGRKARSWFFHEFCESLAKTLDAGCDAAERRHAEWAKKPEGDK